MTDPNYEPEVEWMREEQRRQERMLDDIAFEPDFCIFDDPETADLPTDKEQP